MVNRSLPIARQGLRGYQVRMLWIVAVVLFLAWLLGVVTSYSLHGFLHLLLVAAIGVAGMRLLGGGPPKQR